MRAGHAEQKKMIIVIKKKELGLIAREQGKHGWYGQAE